MAYGTKYQIAWKNEAGENYLYIQQQGYSGSAETVHPAASPFELEWGGKEDDDLNKPLVVSTAKIRFLGDSAGSQLEEVFDSGDREWRVRHEIGGSLNWQGYLTTDLWKDNPDLGNEVVELEAVDGLVLLENDTFDPDWSSDNLYNIARSLIREAQPLEIASNMEWYAFRSTGQISASKLPLSVYEVGDQAFDDLEPIEGKNSFQTTGQRNKKQVLESVLERFGMQLFQNGGRWVMRQRHRIQSDGTIKMWQNQSAVTNDNPTTEDLSASLPFIVDDKTRPRSRVQRLRQTTSSYNYRKLGELVKNGTFETGDFTGWGTDKFPISRTDDPTYVKKYSNTPLNREETQEDTWVAIGEEGSAIAQDVPALIHASGPRAALNVSFEYTVTDNEGVGVDNDTRIIIEDETGTKYYVQERFLEPKGDVKPSDNGTIALKNPVPGDSNTVIIPVGAKLNGSVNTSKPVEVKEPVYGGEDTITAKIPKGGFNTLTYYVWDTGSVFGNDDLYGLANGDLPVNESEITGESELGEVELVVPLNTPNGKSLQDGDLEFKHRHYNNNEQRKAFLNNISFQITIAGDEIESTKYTARDDQAGLNVETNHPIGSGPTFEHPKDINLTGTTVTTGWKNGAYGSSESSTGTLLEEITAKTIMRQQRNTLSRKTYILSFDDEVLYPEHVIEEDGKLYTINYLRRTYGSGNNNNGEVQLSEIKDAGTSGLTRAFHQMESGGGTSGSASGGGSSASSSSGSGVTTWDSIVDSFDVSDGEAAGVPFVGGSIDVSWLRDPNDNSAFKVQDVTNDNKLFTVDKNGEAKAPTINATSTLLLPSSTGGGSGGGGGSVADFDAGRSLFTENVDASTVLNVELVGGSGINLTEVSGTNTNAYEISTSVEVGVNTFAGRSGDVSPSTGDYSASQISGFGSAAVSAIDGSDITPNNVTVSGNLTVNGTQFITNPETVEIQDNLAVINNGETGSGVTEGFAGWEVDRGDLTNYFFGFDEGKDRFVVGQGTSGRQVVATREDSPDGSAIAYWDDTTNKYVTSTDVVVGSNGSSLKAKTVNATGTLLLPSSTGSGSGDGGGSVADFDAGRSLFTESVNGATVLNVELVSGSGINLTEVSGANTNAYKISASVDAGVNTFAGRSGDVSPSPGDYSASQISGFDSAAVSAVTSEDPITFDGTVKAPTLNATGTLLLPTSSGSGGGSGGGGVSDFDTGRSLFTESVDGSTVLNVELVEGSGITLSEVSGTNTNAYKIAASVDAGVNTFAGRSGDVSPSTGDYSASQISGFDSAAASAVSASDVGLENVPNTDIAYSSTIPADNFTSAEVTNLRSGQLEDGTTPWTSNNNYTDLDARSAVSKSDVGLGNVPNTNIAYSSTIPADNFTSAEVSNLRSGQLDDGSTPWTSNNFYDDNDARSAVSANDVGLGNVPNQDPRSEMRNLGLRNEEMDSSWVGGQGGGQVGYDASVGLFLDYGSSGSGVPKDVYPVLDAGNTKTGSNVNVTYGGIDTRPKISLSQGSGSGLNADKLDGVHLSNIGFGDISASRYSDSEARNAVTDTDLPGNLRLTNGGIIGISGGPEIEFEGNGIEVQGVERLSFGDQSGNVNGLDMSNKTIRNAGSIDASGTVDFSSANSVILPTV